MQLSIRLAAACPPGMSGPAFGLLRFHGPFPTFLAELQDQVEKGGG